MRHPVSGQNWACPFCGRSQTLTDAQLRSQEEWSWTPQWRGGVVGHTFTAVGCANPECREASAFVTLYSGVADEAGEVTATGVLDEVRLRPRSIAAVWPDYIPEQIRSDYMEACLIVDLSPKAASTFARRCLQGMIRDFCQISKATLLMEIEALEEAVNVGHAPRGVDDDTITQLNAIRMVGDISAQMDVDVNMIVDVKPGEAELLLKLLEQLADDWYVARAKRTAHLDALLNMVAEKTMQLGGALN